MADRILAGFGFTRLIGEDTVDRESMLLVLDLDSLKKISAAITTQLEGSQRPLAEGSAAGGSAAGGSTVTESTTGHFKVMHEPQPHQPHVLGSQTIILSPPNRNSISADTRLLT